jgi:hypothetical protein
VLLIRRELLETRTQYLSALLEAALARVAVGNHILRYDGEKWRQITPPGKLVAIDVFTLGGDEVWISCDHGTVCKYNPNK